MSALLCAYCPLWCASTLVSSCNMKKKTEFKQGSDLFSEPLQWWTEILQPAWSTRTLLSHPRSVACAIHAQQPCHYLFQHGSDLFLIPRLSASPLSFLRDIFRAVSQILPYIEAHITAHPAVVQDAGLYRAFCSDKEIKRLHLVYW